MADSSMLSIFNDFGIPVPSIYQAEKDTADTQYQQALAGIAQRQAAVSNQYGFKPTLNQSTGALEDMRIDPSLAYSKIMGNLNTHAADMSTLRNNLVGRGLAGASAGQGHQLTGLAAQRANLLRFQQQGETAGIGADYTGQMGGLQNEQAGALHTRDTGYNQAAMDSINYAISNGMFNKATLPDSMPGGGDNSSPTPPGPFQPSPQQPAGAYQGPGVLANRTGAGGQQMAAHLGLPTGVLNSARPQPTTAVGRTAQTGRNSF